MLAVTATTLESTMSIKASVLLLLITISGSLFAEDYKYHPQLSDNFIVSLGAFQSDQGFIITADGAAESASRSIDFGQSLSVDQSATLFNTQVFWKFGKQRKWTLGAQYFSSNSTGERILAEDLHWQDLIFREGSSVEGGIKMAISRLFLGRSFYKDERSDFGAGIGLHIFSITASIKGNVILGDGTERFEDNRVAATAPLPNLGIWYKFSPAKNWLIHTRADWISANIDEYDGTFWNAIIGVNYQAFRNVGFDLSYQYFTLDLGVDKPSWRGSADLSYTGPMLSITGNW